MERVDSLNEEKSLLMKLYFFQCGFIRTKRRLLVKDGGDAPFVVPVPFFLIVHPKGNLLYDCGQPIFAVDDDKNPPFDRDYVSIMSQDDYAPIQLWKAGLASSDISHVVISHMHSDHAGALGSFPNAIHFIQRAELEYGDNQLAIEKLKLKLKILDGEDFLDVFNDGRVKIMFTPGHTPGHQSLLLELPKGGPVLLAGDSVYTEEILAGSLPGVASDFETEKLSIKKIIEMRFKEIRIVTGHDPIAWIKMKLAPAHYE